MENHEMDCVSGKLHASRGWSYFEGLIVQKGISRACMVYMTKRMTVSTRVAYRKRASITTHSASIPA